MGARSLNPSIRPAIAELERVYDACAGRFGLDGKPRPVIVIQRRGRKVARGWLAHRDWVHGGDPVNELTLTAEGLGAGVLEAVTTFLHEMTHHANAVDGISDCSRNQYHNTHFRARAEAAGMVVERQGARGWAHTELGAELAAAVRGLNVNTCAFTVFRPDSTRPPAPTKMRLWVCGCPTRVRCATLLEAQCTRCGTEFVSMDAIIEFTRERTAAQK